LTGNMRSAKLGFEALADVGIIVLAHFRNPARKYAAQLLLDALTLKKRILIRVSTYLGAYIVMTRYLKLRSSHVAKALLKTLSLESRPQKLSTIGSAISIVTLILCILYVSKDKIKITYRKHIKHKQASKAN